MTLSPGTRLGAYEIQSAVGAGGMGEVYQACDTRLERTVAIKVLAADEFLRRFLLHVLPTGFMRIRHVGLLANRTRRGTLASCRRRSDQPAPPPVAVEPLAPLVRRVKGAWSGGWA